MGVTAAASSSWPGRHIGYRKVAPCDFAARYPSLLAEFRAAHRRPTEYDWCAVFDISRNTLRRLRQDTGISKRSTGESII